MTVQNTLQDPNGHAGYIVLPRRLGLGILWSLAGVLIGGGIAWTALQGRVAALEKTAEADSPKLHLINERTIKMENDITWIRGAISAAAGAPPRR